MLVAEELQVGWQIERESVAYWPCQPVSFTGPSTRTQKLDSKQLLERAMWLRRVWNSIYKQFGGIVCGKQIRRPSYPVQLSTVYILRIYYSRIAKIGLPIFSNSISDGFINRCHRFGGYLNLWFVKTPFVSFVSCGQTQPVMHTEMCVCVAIHLFRRWRSPFCRSTTVAPVRPCQALTYQLWRSQLSGTNAVGICV